MEQYILDHKAVYFNLKLQKPHNERRMVVSRRLRGFDFEAFNETIESSGLLDDSAPHTLESLIKEYDKVLHETVDKLAPLKTRIIIIRPHAPWSSEEITIQKRKKCRLERK